MVAVMLLIGLGTGIQPLLGYCYGARKIERYKGIMKFSLLLAVCMSLVMSLICYLGAKPMVNAFLTEKEALENGISFARILIISGPILGVLFVMINAIQSMGAMLPSLVLSICRQGILYIPVLLFMNAVFHTKQALVAAQPTADYMATTLSVILFIGTFRHYFRKTP